MITSIRIKNDAGLDVESNFKVDIYNCAVVSGVQPNFMYFINKYEEMTYSFNENIALKDACSLTKSVRLTHIDGDGI